MEGAVLAAKRQHDQAIFTAWHTAVFAIGMYGGKLKGKTLSDFLSSDEPQVSTTKHAEAIAYFHKIKARGAPVEITRLN